MTLEKIAAAVGGSLHNDNTQGHEAAGVVIDSRKLEKGFVFIATRGERVDGHSFIDSVFEKGALGVICEKAPANPKGAYIVVNDSFQALKDLAEYYRSILNIKVVGITGSVGKTSTKEFVAGVLSKGFTIHKTQGNYNNEIGLPLTILQIPKNCEIAVLEMGISDFGEMHRLSKIAKPDVCVITNIGQCHLENLGTRDGVLKAKTEIFDFMSEGAQICLNGDDDKLITISQVSGKKPFFIGMDENMSVYATDIVSKGLMGSDAIIHINTAERKESLSVNIPLPGEHMVYNALTATAIAVMFGLETDKIKAGLSEIKPIGGRSNVISTDKITVIDDCYNANPVSMKAAVDVLADTKMSDKEGKPSRKVAILGNMFELGENTSELHREVGIYAANKDIDSIICIGDLCKNMFDGIMSVDSFKKEAYYYADKGSMLDNMKNLIKDGDIVLVKASHGMHLEEIVAELV